MCSTAKPDPTDEPKISIEYDGETEGESAEQPTEPAPSKAAE